MLKSVILPLLHATILHFRLIVLSLVEIKILKNIVVVTLLLLLLVTLVFLFALVLLLGLRVGGLGGSRDLLGVLVDGLLDVLLRVLLVVFGRSLSILASDLVLEDIIIMLLVLVILLLVLKLGQVLATRSLEVGAGLVEELLGRPGGSVAAELDTTNILESMADAALLVAYSLIGVLGERSDLGALASSIGSLANLGL